MPTLNTRIKLKYGTLAEWTQSNPTLLVGEIAVVAIPTESETTVGQVTKPAIVFKVGDGTTVFNSLPYASGLAADVYAWAKEAQKPVYTASEVGADPVGTAQSLINALDANFTAASGNYISGITQADGKITAVTESALPTADIPEYTLQAGESDGTIQLMKDGAIVGEAVKVTGWDTLVANVAAKYVKPEGGIPTSDLDANVQANLTLANTAVQPGDLGDLATKDTISESDINGTISVSKIGGLGALATLSEVTDAQVSANANIAQSKISGLTDALSAINSNVASKADSSTVIAINGRLTTAENEIQSLKSNIGSLGNALHFAGAGGELPDSGKDGDVYVVNAGENAGKEFIWANGKWEEFGDTSDYLLSATAQATYLTKASLNGSISGVSANETITGVAVSTDTGVVTWTSSPIANLPTSAVSGLDDSLSAMNSAIGGKENVGVAQTLINALNGNITGSASANKTLTALSQVNGVLTATFSDIAIDASQVTTGSFAISRVSGLTEALANKLEANDIADFVTDSELQANVNAINSVVNTKVNITQVNSAISSELAKHPGIDAVGTVTSVAVDDGLAITAGSSTVNPTIGLNTSALFILDCGSASTNI